MSSDCKCGCGMGRLPSIDKLAVLGVVVGFFGLVCTGIPMALLGKPLEGYLLLVHTSMGGLFACCLAVMALTRAGAGYGLLHKFFFWLTLVLGFVLIMTAVLMMLPLFGTGNMHNLIVVHRYGAYVILVSGVLYCWFTCRQSRES